MYEVYGGIAVLPGRIEKDISIVIDKDRIVDIGKISQMRKNYKFSKSIGSKDSIICPGFIDAHMHSFQVATKGLTSDKSLLDWLKKYIWKWEGLLTRETARACARLSYLELLRSGVTSFVDYTSVRHTEEAFKVAEEFGMRGNIGKTLMDRNSPPELEEDTDTALQDTERLIRKYHNTSGNRLRYFITPRFGITCTDDLLLACKGLSRKYGVMITTHAHESPGELDFDKKNYGMSAIRHFSKIGILNSKLLLVHCVHLSNVELEMLVKSKTNVAHCPGSNMMLASGISDVPTMVGKGMAVGLGSDMGAYYNMSMFDQMRLSCLVQKIRTGKTTVFGHARALHLATCGGADAIGLGSETGSLKIGKKADIVLLRSDSIAFSPENDIVAQIVYSASPSSVDTVICDGKVLMEKGRVLVADEIKIIKEAKQLLGAVSL